jgi:Na+-transporting NADH:ubiquinone oxidoreductase subunit A
MSKDIKIKKGLNIPIKGEADKVLGTVERSSTFVVKPTDFKNFTPKLLVREGDEVLAGSPLFFNKQYPDVKIGSPVSGEELSVKFLESRFLQIRKHAMRSLLLPMLPL